LDINLTKDSILLLHAIHSTASLQRKYIQIVYNVYNMDANRVQHFIDNFKMNMYVPVHSVYSVIH
jgi:hypothetical protein